MTIKQQLGQFYTSNADYILQGMNNSFDNIIEPFTGNGDIIKWGDFNAEMYDIDPKYPNTIQRNTLLNPPSYKDKYVITNPPYLHKNKSLDKTVYNMYNVDDLYKAFIKTIVNGNVKGGIIIIPVNFLCGNDFKIRDIFFSNYNATDINIFEEQVFNDTSIQICVIKFEKGCQISPINITFYPSNKKIQIKLFKFEKWLFGGEIYNKIPSPFKFGRLLIGQQPSTNLKLFASDTGGNKKIRLVIDKNHYYGKQTDRMFATITSNTDIKDEKYICNQFNTLLNYYRHKYCSMFLTSFRNSTTYQRKRISFKLAYILINNIICKSLKS